MVSSALVPPLDAVQAEYTLHAGRYDAHWQRYLVGTIPKAAAAIRLSPGMQLLDVGCGTGGLLAQLAQEAQRAECPVSLYGIDCTAEMLRVAKQKLRSYSNIFLALADAHRLPFADQALDAVVSTSAFPYFSAPELVLAELHRVTKPNGQLVLLTWCDDYALAPLRNLLIRCQSSAPVRTYTVAELESLVTRAGFAVSAIRRWKPTSFWGTMLVQAVKG